MATKPLIELTRGSQSFYTLKVPISAYVPGSLLYFTAKPLIDNDPLDVSAVVKKGFDDTVVTLDSSYATYNLNFLPADLLGVTFLDGATVNEYVGQFEYTVPGQPPIAYPYNNKYIQVKIYADVKVSND